MLNQLGYFINNLRKRKNSYQKLDLALLNHKHLQKEFTEGGTGKQTRER